MFISCKLLFELHYVTLNYLSKIKLMFSLINRAVPEVAVFLKKFYVISTVYITN